MIVVLLSPGVTEIPVPAVIIPYRADSKPPLKSVSVFVS